MIGGLLYGQTPLYDYVSFNKTLKVPEKLGSERTAVIFSIPERNDEFVSVGDPQKFLAQVHQAFDKP